MSTTQSTSIDAGIVAVELRASFPQMKRTLTVDNERYGAFGGDGFYLMLCLMSDQETVDLRVDELVEVGDIPRKWRVSDLSFQALVDSDRCYKEIARAMDHALSSVQWSVGLREEAALQQHLADDPDLPFVHSGVDLGAISVSLVVEVPALALKSTTGHVRLSSLYDETTLLAIYDRAKPRDGAIKFREFL